MATTYYNQPPSQDTYLQPPQHRRSSSHSRPTTSSSNPYAAFSGSPHLQPQSSPRVAFATASPALSTQNPPYHPLTEQYTPPTSESDKQLLVVPYPTNQDIYEIGFTPPRTPPPRPHDPEQQGQTSNYPATDRRRSSSFHAAQRPGSSHSAYLVPPIESQALAPAMTHSRSYSGSYSRPADYYDASLRPPDRERRYSSSSHHSHHSHHSRHSSHSDSGKKRRSKEERKRDAHIASLDRKPSYGDTAMMAWGFMKGVVTGKRD